ncbi:Pentatricopeptide repeat-containing protein [Acorus calamus]|uniref:Pentatricopeptide repeat-containing protein n=1 Tax=Acorus calamus TaxID=4465 RepID=A0AAV9D718_ACOCL|nr:Pentatricopeptide repeat-containing protein [Acorus calamus]
MRSRGVKKDPGGWSWIEIRDTVSVFVVGDQWHPWRDNIYKILDSLTAKADLVDDISELNAITWNQQFVEKPKSPLMRIVKRLRSHAAQKVSHQKKKRGGRQRKVNLRLRMEKS